MTSSYTQQHIIWFLKIGILCKKTHNGGISETWIKVWIRFEKPVGTAFIALLLFCPGQSLSSWPPRRSSPSPRILSMCPGRSRRTVLREERLWAMTSVWFLSSPLSSRCRWCFRRYEYSQLMSLHSYVFALTSEFAEFRDGILQCALPKWGIYSIM